MKGAGATWDEVWEVFVRADRYYVFTRRGRPVAAPEIVAVCYWVLARVASHALRFVSPLGRV